MEALPHDLWHFLREDLREYKCSRAIGLVGLFCCIYISTVSHYDSKGSYVIYKSHLLISGINKKIPLFYLLMELLLMLSFSRMVMQLPRL